MLERSAKEGQRRPDRRSRNRGPVPVTLASANRRYVVFVLGLGRDGGRTCPHGQIARVSIPSLFLRSGPILKDCVFENMIVGIPGFGAIIL